MSEIAEFFLGSRAGIVQLELLEIDHQAFSQTYRIVRNAKAGVTVDLSAEETGISFEYLPVQVQRSGSSGDLDSSIRFDIGDVGTIVPDEIDAVAADGSFQIKPSLRYWSFRSDNLASPIFGPLTMEIPTISFSEEGASFSAAAPSLNSAKTGERYTLDRFPMQRGFL